MSWKYTKKINSNLKKPLDRFIEEESSKIYNIVNSNTYGNNAIKKAIGVNDSFSGVDFLNSTLYQKVNCLLQRSDNLKYASSEDIILSKSSAVTSIGGSRGTICYFTPEFSGNIKIEAMVGSDYYAYIEYEYDIHNSNIYTVVSADAAGGNKKVSAVISVEKGKTMKFMIRSGGDSGSRAQCWDFAIKGKLIL